MPHQGVSTFLEATGTGRSNVTPQEPTVAGCSAFVSQEGSKPKLFGGAPEEQAGAGHFAQPELPKLREGTTRPRVETEQPRPGGSGRKRSRMPR